MAEIRINATGGVKLYDADDSHYCQIVAGTITGNVDILTLNSAGVTVADGSIDFDIASHDTSNGLKLGGTLVTATAAELNIMDGVTSTAAEINLIDGGTARGTTALADGDGVLINDGGTMRMTTVQTVKTYMGGDNTPFFMAQLSSDQTITDETYTKVQFNTEETDPDGTYDNSSNYRFTPGVAGTYYIIAQVNITSGQISDTVIYKNGARIARARHADAADQDAAVPVWTIDVADDDDYYEIFVWNRHSSNSNVTVESASGTLSYFGGFKLIP